jgi:hypothetical protein
VNMLTLLVIFLAQPLRPALQLIVS